MCRVIRAVRERLRDCERCELRDCASACVRAELRNRNSLSSPQSLHVLGFATGVNTAIDTITNFNYTKYVLAIVIQVCSQSLQVCSKHGL